MTATCVYFGYMCGERCMLYFHLLRTFEGNSPTIFCVFACLQMKSLLVNAITPGTLNVFSHAGRRFDLAVYTMCGGMFAVVFVLVI